MYFSDPDVRVRIIYAAVSEKQDIFRREGLAPEGLRLAREDPKADWYSVSGKAGRHKRSGAYHHHYTIISWIYDISHHAPVNSLFSACM